MHVHSHKYIDEIERVEFHVESHSPKTGFRNARSGNVRNVESVRNTFDAGARIVKLSSTNVVTVVGLILVMQIHAMAQRMGYGFVGLVGCFGECLSDCRYAGSLTHNIHSIGIHAFHINNRRIEESSHGGAE